MKVPTLLVALPLLCSNFAQADWTVTDPNLATIIMGVDFTDPATGYLAGAQNGSGPAIWKSTDSGQDFRVISDEVLSMSYMDIAMGPDDFGVASGMGMLYTFSSAAKTTDSGRNWSKTGGKWLYGVSQDVDVPNNDFAVMAGAWGGLTNTYDGVAVSEDQGRNWDMVDWGAPSYARYVDFVDSEVGYVSGGHWPSSSSRSMAGHMGWQVNQHFALPQDIAPKRSQSLTDDSYYGAISKSTDGGRSFEVVLEIDDAYFNGIHFVDANNGWVVGEGSDSAFIYNTSDGGESWDLQWTGLGSLLQVKMANEQFGFAVGADLSSLRPGTLLLETQNGGQDWTPVQLDEDFYLLNLDVLDTSNAWAVGLNMSTNLCGVLRYTAD